jgi:hypothetical protein
MRSFGASRGWFHCSQKQCDLRSVKIHGEDDDVISEENADN